MRALRRRFRDSPLATKVLWLNGVVATLISLIVISLAVTNSYWAERQELLDTTQVDAQIVGQNAVAALVFDDRKTASDILASWRSSPDVRYAALYNDKGELFASYLGESERGTPSPALEHTAGHTFSSGHLEVRQALEVDKRPVGALLVRVSLRKLHTAMLRSAVAAVSVTLVGLTLVLLVLKRLVPKLLRPLSDLTNLMNTISLERKYSARAPVHCADEIGSLAQVFNQMVAQIESHEGDLQQELSERRKTEEQLEHLAKHDVLTGLPNRHYFNGRLEHALARARRHATRIALLFLDLDNFKNVNDSLGHHVGDALLARLAERLKSVLRGSDVLCRLGGDEFALIVEDIETEHHAAAIAQKLLRATAEPMVIEGSEIYAAASIGVILSDPASGDSATLLRNADVAMYHAKNAGKGNYRFFHPDMNTNAMRRMAIENNLRQALARNELSLVYQPQFDTRSRRVVAAEALLRWNSIKLGNVSPTEFIPVAEDTGLILSLGDWVLNRACADAAAWQSRGLQGVPVSVNFSARQLAESDAVTRVADALQRSGLAANMLEIELTETVLLDQTATSRARLDKLRALGVTLVIDDFGLGYSSMSYLRKLPTQRLKVDRSFVDDLPDSSDDAAITSAIVALAHALGMQVIAEGVETEAQAEFLSSVQCDRLQGYLLGRPIALDTLLARFAQPVIDVPTAVNY